MRKVLTIAGSDSSGGAGIQADIKTFEALKTYGLSVLTALTAQNTRRVDSILNLPPEFIEAQFNSVLSDIKINAAKTGMLANHDTIKAVVKALLKYQVTNLVIDPVMVSKSGHLLLETKAVETMVDELFPLAVVVTPNIDEAQALAGIKIYDQSTLEQAALLIYRRCAKNVLITGTEVDDDDHITDLFYDGVEYRQYRSVKLKKQGIHGSGCTFSAAIAAYLALDKELPEAIGRAKKYITQVINYSFAVGNGYPVGNHFFQLFRDEELRQTIKEVSDGVYRLKQARMGRLIPEVQSNLVMAFHSAQGLEEVVGIPGRIIKVGDEIEVLRAPCLGGSQHMGKVVLTVMRSFPHWRAAMAIKYNETIIKIADNLNFTIASFDRNKEPLVIQDKEGFSLEWGTREALKSIDSPPDLIYDTGSNGKEPVCRILGENVASVVDKVLKILDLYSE